MKRYYKIIDGVEVFFTQPLIYDGMQIFNPTEELILDAGWIEYIEPVYERTLEEAKEEKVTDIDIYDESSDVNSIIVNGTELWIPAEQRAILKTSIDAYKALGYTTVTKVWEGQEYSASPDNWLMMINVVEVYASECFNTTARHKAAVNVLTTIEEVDAYDYTTNYPDKPEFNL